jgi:DNA polymerase-3 subunit alpha
MSRPGSRLEKKAPSGGAGQRRYVTHLVLLAKDQAGYKNLTRLATAAHIEGYYYKPRIDKEILAQHSEGLIALSGCLASEIPDMILRDDLAKARDAIDWFKQTMGPDSFLPRTSEPRHSRTGKGEQAPAAWSKEFGLKCVATNDVHYVEKSHSHAHDCLICIGTQALLTDTKRMRYQTEQFFLRSEQEMKAIFADTPDARVEHARGRRSNAISPSSSASCTTRFSIRRNILRVRDICVSCCAEGLHRRYTIARAQKGMRS